MPRSEARAKNYLTWISQVIVHKTLCDQPYFLLTLRSKGDNRRYADCWQTGYTETIDSYEDAVSAAARGGDEELGIGRDIIRQRLRYLFEVHYRNPMDEKDMKNAEVFELDYDGCIIPNSLEIAITKWVSLAELDLINAAGTVEGKLLTPLSMEVWENYRANVLE